MSYRILRPGEVYREVALSHGRKAILRVPNWLDLDNHVSFINELVKERAEIQRSTNVSREEETDWLGRRLAAIEKGDLIVLVAEGDGLIVANSEVGLRAPGFPEMSHLGNLGIAILSAWRGVGLGMILMNSLLELAKEAGFKIIVLDVFASNKIARHLYEKVGFVEAGKIPKAIHRNGNYIDLIRMVKDLGNPQPIQRSTANV